MREGRLGGMKLARSDLRRLVRQLASQSYARSSEACNRLRSTNDEALELLEQMAGGPSARSQLLAAEALANFALWGQKARRKRAERILVGLARHRDPQVIAAAVGALGAQLMFESGPLVMRVSTSHPVVAFAVAGALGKLRPRGFEKKLIPMLRSRDVDVRSWAAFELASSGIDSPAIRRALFRTATRDPHHDPRGEALMGLAHLRDPRARPLIVRALRARFRGIWAVEAAIEAPDGSYIPELLAAFRRLHRVDARDHQDAFLEAIWASARVGDEPPISARALGAWRALRRGRSRRRRARLSC